MIRILDRDAILTTFRQTSRYGLVGLYSNTLLYLLYLALTALDMEHKLAMSLVFAIGVAITYHLNKDWSFGSTRKDHFLFMKYALIYASAYMLNLFLLWLLVDVYGFVHQIVQGVVIFVCAGFIFINLKFWVFRR